MNVDLTHLPPSTIAATATLLAAIIAGMTVCLSTWINTRSASRVARDAARREFRLSAIKPYLDSLDGRIALYREIIEKVTVTAAALKKIPTLTRLELEVAKPELDALAQQWPPIAERLALYRDILSSNTGLLAFVASDRRVVDAFYEWLEPNRLFLELLVSGGITGTPETLRALEAHVSKALSTASALRLSIEGFLFGRRSWLSRLAYYLWSRSRALWREWKQERRPG
jgi:hypothetical protein